MTTRALLRVNLRGAFFVLKIYPGSQLLENSESNFEESIMDKNYKLITSMKEVPEQLRKITPTVSMLSAGRDYLQYFS